jgi:hypothetical protein
MTSAITLELAQLRDNAGRSAQRWIAIGFMIASLRRVRRSIRRGTRSWCRRGPRARSPPVPVVQP